MERVVVSLDEVAPDEMDTLLLLNRNGGVRARASARVCVCVRARYTGVVLLFR